jgi:hypothetical protein
MATPKNLMRAIWKRGRRAAFSRSQKVFVHFGMTKDEGVVLYFVGTGPSTTDNLEK